MLQYFALPTGTGAAVCYDSLSLGGALAVMECATLQQARHEAIRRNLIPARHPVNPLQERQSSPSRYFESEAA